MAWHPQHRGHRRPVGLLLALLLYTLLATLTIRDMGRVGEVARSWTHGHPAKVVVSTDPLRWADGAADLTAGHRLGPLVASQARPIEYLQLGELKLPVAVNQYTGGLADWPSRILVAVTGAPDAAVLMHLLLGALIIILVHRFLRFHGTDIAATIAALVLATDWGFHFYRKALGGTEILLQAGVLLCLWALWSRRWAGGRHGLRALGIGVGIGLLAKLTFILSLAALFITAVLLRRDKPPLRPALPDKPWRFILWTLLLISPLVITALHHSMAVPDTPHIRSHDFVQMQWSRVMAVLSGGSAPARESVAALWAWLGDPSRFLETAMGAQVSGAPQALRWTGWLIILGGTIGAWRDRHPTPHLALLRFTSLFLILQVGLVWGIAKDMHHLGMATPVAAIVAGLAMDTLMGRFTPPRSPARALASTIIATPWLIAGMVALQHTDVALSTVQRPSLTRSGQSALGAMLHANGVQKLIVIDYELAGAIEPEIPDIEVVHGWGLASRHNKRALKPLLRLGAGHHLLVIPGAPPWIYNLKPRSVALEQAASEVGLSTVAVDRLPDDGAVLYALRATAVEN